MDDWKVMLLVFSGFVAVVAVCVGLITAQIVGTHFARRPRADSHTTIKVSRSVAFALCSCFCRCLSWERRACSRLGIWRADPIPMLRLT
jgi:hypothetical protein